MCLPSRLPATLTDRRPHVTMNSSNRGISHVRFHRYILLRIAVLLIAGCKQEEEISVTTVRHPDREAIRLKVAAIKRDKMIWFIRMSGPVAEIGKHEAEFEDFVHRQNLSRIRTPRRKP